MSRPLAEIAAELRDYLAVHQAVDSGPCDGCMKLLDELDVSIADQEEHVRKLEAMIVRHERQYQHPLT